MREIVRFVEAQGIEFRCLYLDRAFFTADIIHYLQERDIQLIMPAIVRGKGDGKGTRAFMKGRAGCTTLYTMRSAKTCITVTVPIHVVVTYSKGRREKNKAMTYRYASSAHHPPLVRMQEEYHLRFGMESSCWGRAAMRISVKASSMRTASPCSRMRERRRCGRTNPRRGGIH